MTESDWSHSGSSTERWADQPSMFLDEVTHFFNPKGHTLELGAGLGTDSRTIVQRDVGAVVTSTDVSADALKANIERTSLDLRGRLRFATLDLRESLPYRPQSFDTVYAHLSLHYFKSDVLQRITNDVYECLKNDGIFACLLNSKDDPEFGTGIPLGEDMFEIKGMRKRYFDVESFRPFVRRFEPLIFDNNGSGRKDLEKNVQNLIRFVGRKK